jgi:hypothetical protein
VPEDLLRPQLGEPHHHAYVVDDIEAIAERLANQLGAGPFFLVEDVPLDIVLCRGARPRSSLTIPRSGSAATAQSS